MFLFIPVLSSLLFLIFRCMLLPVIRAIQLSSYHYLK